MAATSGEVAMVVTTSTSFITGAGLKKCIPTTSPARDVAPAHSTTGNEVLVVTVRDGELAPDAVTALWKDGLLEPP